MTDYRALGGVSATLQALLADRMDQPFGSAVPVTVGTPPFTSRDNDPHIEAASVNLFLYRVSENAALQNQEIPGRGASAGYGHPPLSLKLHYLVTGYGTTQLPGVPMFDDSQAQLVLGSAMRVLHDVPIITDALTTVRAPSGAMVLHPSLRGEFEQVKVTLEPLTLEDVTKVWTALALRYRLSAGYAVSVVQIKSKRAQRIPRLVGQPVSATTPPLPDAPPTPGPMVHVLTIQTPTVTDVKVIRAGTSVEQPFAYAAIGDDLVLRGTSLSGLSTAVMFGDVEVPAKSADPLRVVATIPDAFVAGVGPIAPDLQLQPGVRTVRVIVRDPAVPQHAFSSNDAAFMLVPSVNPASISYAAAPRRLTIGGSRLIGISGGGETMIGRNAVARASYIVATPTQIVVPISDALPTRGTNVIVGNALPDPIVFGTGVQQLSVTIGPATHVVTVNLPPSIPRDSVAAILASRIHDTDPNDPRFTGTRVDLSNGALIVVPGGLTDSISIGAFGGSTLASDLGLLVAPLPGATSALLSGALSSPPILSSASPRLQFRVGAQPALTLNVPRPTTLASFAADLQSAINAGVPAEYANARVAVSGTQLLVIPGAAAAVAFDVAPGDDTTVAELQLRAQFAVRVRVNGAESIDSATVVLPQ